MTKEIIVDENAEALKNSDGSPLIFDIDPGFEIELVELPAEFDIESFFKSTDEIDDGSEIVMKPYPNEHSCPCSSSKFERVRSGSRTHDGKRYRVLYGKVEGSNKWIEASLRYPKSVWSAAEARAHCKAHGGIAFEGAVAKVEEAETGEFSVKKADELRHLVYMIALEPNKMDLQRDIESGLEVEKAAHRYMLRLWEGERPAMIGSEHEQEISDAIVVENYVAPVDFYFENTPQTPEYLVRKGSWVICALIADDIEFQKILDGEYTGMSIQGHGKRREIQ